MREPRRSLCRLFLLTWGMLFLGAAPCRGALIIQWYFGTNTAVGEGYEVKHGLGVAYEPARWYVEGIDAGMTLSI